MTNRLCACVVAGTLCAGVAFNPSTAFAQAPPVSGSGSASGLAAPVGDSAFRHLFGDALRDLSRMPSRETFTLLSIGAVAAAFGHQVDGRMSRSLSQSRSADAALAAGETLGGMHVQLAGATAMYALGRLTDHGRVTAVGVDLVRAQLVTQTLTMAIKTAVGRTRPDGTHYSFPSGHSSTSFATATVLQRNFGWKAGVPAYAAATYVAASRIQDRRHFLSDVVFGAAIGIAAGRTVTIGRGDHQLALAPAAVPGGAGFNVTWTKR